MDPSKIKTSGITIHKVICDTGAGGYAMVEFSHRGRGERSYGVRWNGQEEEIGYPSARGYPVFFELPREMAEVLLGHYRANEG